MAETTASEPTGSPRIRKSDARRLRLVAVRTSLAYAGIAALYILLSDRLVLALVTGPAAVARVQTSKGWAFVAITAALLYLSLRGQLRRWEREAAERHRAEETLRTRIGQIRTILAHQPIAVFACDRDGVFTLWEGRTWPDEEFPPAETIGRRLEEMAGPWPALAGVVRCALQGETSAIEQRVRARTLEIYSSPLEDAAGARLGASGVVVDVTERKKLEAQLLRAQRLESVGRLAGGVAHDLNNILSPVLIGATLLRDRVSEPDSLALLETIEASAHRGAGVIRQLLTFSRGGAGEIVPVHLPALVLDMRALIRETFPRNIVVQTQVPAGSFVVQGDSTQLHQVLMNLCVNARDAMPEGGTLTLALERTTVGAAGGRESPPLPPGEFITVRIQDTGTGIAAADLEHIFDPFFTTKQVGHGSGLGLSTVLGIVKSHGGCIQVESTAGQGATFRVHLPASPMPAEPAPAPAAPPAPVGQGECVLVVDDEPSVRRMIRQTLELTGHRVREAEDGADALVQYQHYRDDIRVILTDVMMPVQDGIALVRDLRARDVRIPVIAMTGVGDTAKSDELRRLGVDHFLAKPFSTADLLATVRRLLGPTSPG